MVASPLYTALFTEKAGPLTFSFMGRGHRAAGKTLKHGDHPRKPHQSKIAPESSFLAQPATPRPDARPTASVDPFTVALTQHRGQLLGTGKSQGRVCQQTLLQSPCELFVRALGGCRIADIVVTMRLQQSRPPAHALELQRGERLRGTVAPGRLEVAVTHEINQTLRTGFAIADHPPAGDHLPRRVTRLKTRARRHQRAHAGCGPDIFGGPVPYEGGRYDYAWSMSEYLLEQTDLIVNGGRNFLNIEDLQG